jgi:hypothetical protein
MKRKVKQLAKEIFTATQQQFPEIQFLDIQEHPEQYDRYWIIVTGEMEEEREMDMNMFSGEIATRILIDEGYSFGVMLRTPRLEAA